MLKHDTLAALLADTEEQNPADELPLAERQAQADQNMAPTPDRA